MNIEGVHEHDDNEYEDEGEGVDDDEDEGVDDGKDESDEQ